MLEFTTSEGHSTVELLSNPDILSLVKEMCGKTQSKLQIAVAYWGDGALKETELSDRIKSNPETVKVICDLESGACNPQEVQCLLDKNVQVRTLKNFHAKIWICDDVVIVGSANASSNGLGFFNDKTSNTEAAICVTDKSFAHEARQWFDDQWNHKKAVYAQHRIYLARLRWKARERAKTHAQRKLTGTERRKRYPKETGPRYKEFFADLLKDLITAEFPRVQKLCPSARNRLSIKATRTRIYYDVRFPRRGREKKISVELVIRTHNQNWNDRMYSKLERNKATIDPKFEQRLIWDPDEGHQQSRIGVYRDGKIDDPDSKLDEYRTWMIEQIFVFKEVFSQFIDD